MNKSTLNDGQDDSCAALSGTEPNVAKLLEVQELAGVFSWEAELASHRFSCSPGLSSWLTSSSCPQLADLWLFIDPMDRDAADEAWEQCLKHGVSKFTHRVILDGGRTRTIQHYLKAFRNPGTTDVKHVCGLLLDVTRRESLNYQLAEAHSELASILESVGEGVYAIDESGRITEANPAAAEALGYEVDELIGRNAHQTLHYASDDGVPRASCDCKLHNSKATNQIRTEETLWRSDGTSFPASCVSTRICDSDGITSGAVITFRDLTEERLRQAQLAQAQKLESIGQLAAGVAHEINTPMQYIGDNVRYITRTFEKMGRLLELLPVVVDERIVDEDLIELRHNLSGVLSSKKVRSSLQQIPEALADCAEGVTIVSRIVAALKEFSHPGGEEMRKVNLQKVLDSAITVAKNTWKYVADVDFDPSIEIDDVRGFPSELNQAFLNIIVNAAHAIGDRVQLGHYSKGRIVVSAEVAEGNAIVRITDNGGGIPDSIRDRVMEPFFTTKEIGRGTGQGLSIVHNVIVNKHGGQLTFEIQDGVGTTFVVQLPLFVESNEANESSASTVASDGTNS